MEYEKILLSCKDKCKKHNNYYLLHFFSFLCLEYFVNI